MSQSGNIPLWRLCEEGKVDEVRIELARTGQDVNAKAGGGRTGLMWAVRKNHNSIVRLLLEEPTLDLNCSDSCGQTALHFAAENDNVEGVQLLLADHRLKTGDHKNFYGLTPVMLAMKHNNVNALRELVGHPSVSLDTVDGLGKSLEEVARLVFYHLTK